MKKMILVTLGLLCFLSLSACSDKKNETQASTTHTTDEEKITTDNWSLVGEYRSDTYTEIDAMKNLASSANYTLPMKDSISLVSMNSDKTFSMNSFSSIEKTVEISGHYTEKKGIYSFTYDKYKYISSLDPETVVDKSDIMKNSFSYFIDNNFLYAVGSSNEGSSYTVIKKYTKIPEEEAAELISKIDSSSFK
ncbi:hypothetical protein ACWOC1_08715 [Enterococcus quebecensis]|uniref:DUF4367 domain-containing protein n=1 Tax=Enterococcus quebecensis TaxID=903983 RepID=A0A1E5GQ88_9ENTE|nr:hypothetical protein [Enterococcus quebecensis]OEG14839.1 hypothetical protein BCR23_12140 [Enterococcus quebecensis]OJG73943.1 hypothetical protein RV12_GL000524 [Enterococcus quebecensis]